MKEESPIQMITDLLNTMQDKDSDHPGMRETPRRFYEALSFWDAGV